MSTTELAETPPQPRHRYKNEVKHLFEALRRSRGYREVWARPRAEDVRVSKKWA